MDITKFRILQDNVLVLGIEIEMVGKIKKSKSYENKPELGRVINIGDKITTVKVGETVLFNKYSSTKYNLDGKDYFIVRAEDIVAAKDEDK